MAKKLFHRYTVLQRYWSAGVMHLRGTVVQGYCTSGVLYLRGTAEVEESSPKRIVRQNKFVLVNNKID